ncbi:MAG: hypothetical protein RIS08_490 [Actinomycetota bacterium]|jgi:hypothetical protein
MELDPQDDHESERPKRKSVAETALELAIDLYEFRFTDSGEVVAIKKSGLNVAFPFFGSGKTFKSDLALEVRKRRGVILTDKAFREIATILEADAASRDAVSIPIRISKRGGRITYDLGDVEGRAIEVDATGWIVAERPDESFFRTVLTKPQIEPSPGGAFEEMFRLINVPKDKRDLFLGALVSAFFPEIAHPIIGIDGEQGSGKSLACELIVDLIDPSTVPKRKPPKDVESWTTVAKGSYVICIDNLSKISPQISDALCRASTGDGDVQRQLFTNGGLYVTSFRKVVIINGIRVEGIQDDLADRLIRFKLPVIPSDVRQTESSIRDSWLALKPSILAGLLTIVSKTLASLSSVKLSDRPRMADFAEILAAMDLAIGTHSFAQYLDEVSSSALDSLAGDPVVNVVAKQTAPVWTGRAKDLVDLIQADTFSTLTMGEWPSTAKKMSAWLTRIAPTLRKAGWIVDDLGSANHQNTTIWKIVPPASFASEDSHNSSPSILENENVSSGSLEEF